MKIINTLFCLVAFVFLTADVYAKKKNNKPGNNYLWQIGQPDKSAKEFLQTQPNNFTKDGFYIVGKSNVNRDWPFVQPGPDDGWAGSKAHTYTVLFGLQNAASSGNYQLQVDLTDVGTAPVNITVKVNGEQYKSALTPGTGASIYGNLSSAKAASLHFEIPAKIFHGGNNRIDITTESGSWFLYDWIALEAPSDAKLQSVKPELTVTESKGLPFVLKQNGRLYQPVQSVLMNTGDSSNVTIKIDKQPEQRFGVGKGNQKIEFLVPVVIKDSLISFSIQRKGKPEMMGTVAVQPVPKRSIYLLPHSHHDIGYTEIQTDIEKKQINNLLTGIQYSNITKNYPPGARFVWNLEGAYAADLFMHRMNAEQQNTFVEAVKNGGVALNGMYVNTLTGLCRPEELLQLFRYSNEVAEKCGTSIKSAMISDVPGYTWGTVTAMSQAGIRYFSVAPNYFDRIGDILQKWEDKPFWWVSPSGKEKVLVWIPYRGYALSHTLPNGLSKDFVEAYMAMLEQKKFPYNITYLRWSGHGDNAVPDMSISDFVKDWSTKYEWPKFIISSTTTAFEAFEKEYGEQLPVEKGDWTGYWEDGAGSSALETSENRTTSSRLTQAEALWAMLNPSAFPSDSFHQAWQNTILYSEHTWGADESVTNPLSQKTMEQWIIKKSYATLADTLSHQLIEKAIQQRGENKQENTFDVYNTNSWSRTSLIKLSAKQSALGDVVKDAKGIIIPSQKLSTGELAFVAADVPPFASKRYTLSQGLRKDTSVSVKYGTDYLDNGMIRLQIDTTTGAVKSLRVKDVSNEFVDAGNNEGINDYLYLPGNNLADIQRIKHVDISVKEKGPLLSTLIIKSEAPGCTKLVREVTLVKGFDFAELTNILDKKPAELNPYPGDYQWANLKGKESLNIAFPFHVPGGEIKLEAPMSVIRPEADQIPSACRNWMEVNGWADVSNKDYGITWVTLDAPLVEIGDITATLLGGQTNPAVWRKKIDPTQRLYSWALNNHWETNYRAYQQGSITFRYALQPHTKFDPVSSTRLATNLAQLMIVSFSHGVELSKPLLQLSSDQVVVLALKPSADGKAWIVTLYNPTEKQASTNLNWNQTVGTMHYSNTAEATLGTVPDQISLNAYDVVTVRVERKAN